MSRIRAVRLAAAVLAGLATAGWGSYRVWPREIRISPVTFAPVWERAAGRTVVTVPTRFLVAEVATYDDEFLAYLMYRHLAGASLFRGAELLMTYKQQGSELVYAIRVFPGNDLLEALPLLAAAQASGCIRNFDWRFVDGETLRELRYQTWVFNSAYQLPARRKLEDVTRAELAEYLRRFLRLKSITDPRIRRDIQPAPKPLSSKAAHQLAEDIIDVAGFYGLPLDLFLGIGAMENNYMNVTGDLEHAVWKRRAEKGDTVLKRSGGRVLVLNPSFGVWQITRETLRHAHALYLKDSRDYSLLPPRLRPGADFDPDRVDPEVLTTYAGLLFRHLIDRFHGDAGTAVAAYNGGPRRPNPDYEASVRAIAACSRRILEEAAVLQGRRAAGMRFLSARP